MSVKLNVRQVGDVTVMDAEGRITLGEGSSTFRENAFEQHSMSVRLRLLTMFENVVMNLFATACQ